MIEFETEHLMLRQWREEDFSSYSKLTSNKDIMKFFPKLLTLEESNIAAKKFQQLIKTRGWGFWVVEEKVTKRFVGYAGLHAPKTLFPFSPCIEIAWRMQEQDWDNGYMLESGKAILELAFSKFHFDEIVYFSSIKNEKAKKYMLELGMVEDKKRFFHPFVDIGHDLSEHYLYRIKKYKV